MFRSSKEIGKFLAAKTQRTSAYRYLAGRFVRNIRIGEANDQERLLVHSWWNPGYSGTSVPSSPHTTDFVAKKGNRVVGYVQLVRRSENFKSEAGHWLFGLLVRPLYRNMGIGEALSRKVIEQASQEGARELLLLVHEDNRNAVELYRKLGFERRKIEGLEESLEKERSATGRRRVVMGKLL